MNERFLTFNKQEKISILGETLDCNGVMPAGTKNRIKVQ